MCPRDEQIHVKLKLIACSVLCVAAKWQMCLLLLAFCVAPEGHRESERINCTAVIRVGLGGGVKGTDRDVEGGLRVCLIS